MLRTMPAGANPSPRVLLGGMTPIEVVGMRRLLEDAGVAVTDGGTDANALVAACSQTHPDGVVLEAALLGDHCEDMRAAAPEAKLVLWTRVEGRVEVFDAGSETPRQVASAAPAALVNELANPGEQKE
jgi:hypothetical protein